MYNFGTFVVVWLCEKFIDNLLEVILMNQVEWDEYLETEEPVKPRDFIAPHKRSNSDVPMIPLLDLPPVPENIKSQQIYQDDFIPQIDLIPDSLKVEIPVPEYTLDSYQNFIDNDQFEEADNLLVIFMKRTKDSESIARIAKNAADVNRRIYVIPKVISLLKVAVQYDPFNSNYLLELAQTLDENGQNEDAEKLIFQSLPRNNYDANIITKMIRMLERRMRYSVIRNLLGFVYQGGSENSLLPGILFELKHGNPLLALHLLESRCSKMEWKGNFYLELVESCYRLGLRQYVTQYVKKGSQVVPSLFALWNFEILQQTNPEDIIRTYDNVCQLTSLASTKLVNIAAYVSAILGNLKLARECMSKSIAILNSENRWKLLYNSALIELLKGDKKIVPLLLQSSLEIAPRKCRAPVHILLAKVYELEGDLAKAKATYKSLSTEYPDDWHVHYEYALFLYRQKKTDKAIKRLTYTSNGRLMALRVQLEPMQTQVEEFKKAIQTSPKSGEVWLEGAKIAMNPLLPYFSLRAAKFYLRMAYLFTPQYLDILVEMTRLQMLINGLYCDLSLLQSLFISSEGNHGTVFYHFRKLGCEFTSEEFDAMVDGVRKDLEAHSRLYAHAIARTAFVFPSIRDEEIRFANDVGPYTENIFAYGITTFCKNNELMDILGSSAVFL